VDAVFFTAFMLDLDAVGSALVADGSQRLGNCTQKVCIDVTAEGAISIVTDGWSGAMTLATVDRKDDSESIVKRASGRSYLARSPQAAKINHV
jgi:hypothetical protein